MRVHRASVLLSSNLSVCVKDISLSIACQVAPGDTVGGMPKPIGINHVALEVGDVDAALAWYGAFLDLELRGRIPGMAIVDLGDQFLALAEGPGARPDDERHFGLVVDDKEATRAAMAAAGIDVAASGGLRGR